MFGITLGTGHQNRLEIPEAVKYIYIYILVFSSSSTSIKKLWEVIGLLSVKQC